MPPLIVTFDKTRLKSVRLFRDGAGPVTALGEYEVLSTDGTRLLGMRIHDFILSPAVQANLNTLWDAGITQVNTKEGTTSAS